VADAVGTTQVNLEAIKPWISTRVTELLGGVEDEVLIGMIVSYLEDTGMHPKQMMTELLSFLEKNTSLFMKELWSLLISAQQSDDGVPLQLVRAKEEEVSVVVSACVLGFAALTHTRLFALQLQQIAALVQCSACNDRPHTT